MSSTPIDGPPEGETHHDHVSANLPPNLKSEEALHVLPDLIFHDGDVVIELGPTSDDWPLIHKSAVEVGLPILAPAFKSTWSRSKVLTHPQTGKHIEVFTFAIKFVQDLDYTYILKSDEFIDREESCDKVREFSRSSYAPDGWPEHLDYASPFHLDVIPYDSARILKALIAIIYGYNITSKAIRRPARRHKSIGREPYWLQRVDQQIELVGLVSEVTLLGCYAEFYGCLDRVVPCITAMLLAHPGLWHGISDHPGFFMALACKLQCTEMYLDALRHQIGRCAMKGELKDLAESLDLTEKEARVRYLPLLDEQRSVLDKLPGDILALDLTICTTTYFEQPVPNKTSFFEALKFKRKDRSRYAKSREQQDLLARHTLTQWFIKQCYGCNLGVNGSRKVKGMRTGGFNGACKKLLAAAGSEDPVSLLGFKVPSRLTSIFNLDRAFQPARHIHECLVALIKEAAELVEKAFCPRTQTTSDGCTLTYRSAREDADDYRSSEEYCTFLPLDEENLLWEDDEHNQPSPISAVNLQKGSPGLVAVLGDEDPDIRAAFQTVTAEMLKGQGRFGVVEWQERLIPDTVW